ncbi:MAG TPA: nuclease-related domain-containing protein [Chloroflexia bacterium]|nr:nuclease-related domain-containing protein [Chloroflexia bacterium]
MRVVLSPTITINTKKYQRDLILALLLAGLGLVFLILGLFIVQGFLILVCLVLALGLLLAGAWYGMAYLEYIQKQQIQEKLSQILLKSLGDEFIYLRNLVLPGQRSIGEIDGVLLGPPGAIVIHVENHAGEYVIEGDTWYRNLRGKVSKPAPKPLAQHQPGPAISEPRRRMNDSPSWKSIRTAREVKAWLSVRGLPQVVVQPLVVLGHGKIHSIKRPSTPVIELWHLEEYLSQKLIDRRFNNEVEPLAEVVVEQIVHRLQTNGD